MPGRWSGDAGSIRRRDLERELIRRWVTCLGSRAAKKPGAGRNRPPGIFKIGATPDLKRERNEPHRWNLVHHCTTGVIRKRKGLDPERLHLPRSRPTSPYIIGVEGKNCHCGYFSPPSRGVARVTDGLEVSFRRDFPTAGASRGQAGRDGAPNITVAYLL
jgi:hypothetical protein